MEVDPSRPKLNLLALFLLSYFIDQPLYLVRRKHSYTMVKGFWSSSKVSSSSSKVFGLLQRFFGLLQRFLLLLQRWTVDIKIFFRYRSLLFSHVCRTVWINLNKQAIISGLCPSTILSETFALTRRSGFIFNVPKGN